MSIILFGFKGCGKTHFGKLLSKELNYPFIDIDALIMDLYATEHEKTLPIHEIHSLLTDINFRVLEKKAIHSLNKNAHAVIALGGGSVLDLDNVAYLQTIGKLVYLRSNFETLQDRIFKIRAPSFVDPTNPLTSLQSIYKQRLPIYESIPAICIDIDILDEKECINIITKMVSHGC